MAKGGCIVTLLLLATTFTLSAQSPWEVSLGGEYMMTDYSYLSLHNTWGTGLQATCFPYVTDGYAYGLKLDFGLAPQSICGNRLGAAFLIRTPVHRWLDVDLGLGLASYSKPSYVTGDPANLYISTPLVCLFDFGLVAPLDSRSHIAFRVLHSSNGNMRRPNRGLNYFRLEMGFNLDERPRGWKGYGLRTMGEGEGVKDEVNVMVAPSLSFSRHNLQHGLFFCYDLSLSYEYYVRPQLGVGGTVDLWYNFSHPWQLPRYHDPYTLPVYFSALVFAEHFWGPVSVRGGVGMVLAASTRVMVPYYERLAVYYNFGHNYAGIGINAHGGQAEFIEWSFGHRFPLTKRKK